jgi:tetratricopeptide (TPR) repeat protein
MATSAASPGPDARKRATGVADEDGARLAPRTVAARVGALHREGKFADAEALLREAIAAHPGDFDLLHLRGVMLAALKRHREAVWSYRAALARNPEAAGTWTNLGNALTQLDQVKSAVACHRRAIALSRRPDAPLHRNLGISLAAAGQHAEAVVAYSKALELDPDLHTARWDRALAYLHLGNLRQGFIDYEARRDTGGLPTRALPGTAWDGQPYAGRRLLVVCEQGFGDMLWVARYFPRVKALGGTLVIECRPELIPLIAHMGVADAIVRRGDPLPETELHCFLCSLPGLFTPDLAAIPREAYLTAPRERVARMEKHFGEAPGRLKVGIVWSGSVTFGKNARRAQPLASFLQAFALPGVRLYSLQKGPPAAELGALAAAPIADLAPLLDDFADTAAALEQLDLVIMTDSAVAHLAGAMGKPVWLLLGHDTHWLWLGDRPDSPWYPSLRLFRPRAEGDWAHVFDFAAAELMGMVGEPSRATDRRAPVARRRAAQNRPPEGERC